MSTRNSSSRWRVVGASVRGTSHEKTGQPCQDAHAWNVLPNDVLVAAVADGAGSAPLGDVGSMVASRAVVDFLAVKLAWPWPQADEGWHLLLTDAVKTARHAVEAAAAAREVSPRELATTLIAVIATAEFVAAAQVGDGAAVIGEVDGKAIALTAPQSGEYINETTFLVSPNAIDKTQVAVWRGAPAHLAVFSDGLQMLALKLPDGAAHAPFFAPLFRFVAQMTEAAEAQEQLKEFLHSPRITARADDDLTLLLAALV
jgi:hypothetical protein